MLKVVSIADRKLIEKVKDGKKHISNFNMTEFEKIENLVVIMPYEVRSELLKKIVSPIVPMLQYDEQHPAWFDNDTKFSDSNWNISIKLDNSTWKRNIDFKKIILNDGNALTFKKHQPLLNAIKEWLVFQGHPLCCGGKILKPITIKRRLVQTFHLIDAFLVNAEEINLAERHMNAVNNDLVLDILSNLSNGIASGLGCR